MELAGSGTSMDVYNFGTNGAAGTNATRGVNICAWSTVGYIPTSLQLDKKQATQSPAYSLALFSTSNSSSVFSPLIGGGTIRFMTQSTNFETQTYDLTATAAAFPQISNSAAGFCIRIAAIWTPGQSVFTTTVSGNTYSTSLGDWFFDNVFIYGVPVPSSTPSSTATGTASVSFGSTPSSTATGTPSSSQSPTGTSTATATPSSTSTASASLACPPVGGVLTGNSGYFTGTLATSGYAYTGTCPVGSVTGYAKTFLTLNLDPGTALGGSLFITTCNPATNRDGSTLDTVIGIGTGCGNTFAGFNALACNDDSSSATPPLTCTNIRASALTLTGVNRLTYTVAVMLYSANSGGAFGLNFSYIPPTASPTPTQSATSSQTSSATSSASMTASISFGSSPTQTGSSSQTASQTPSSSQTGTSTRTSSQTPTPSVSCPPPQAELVGNSGVFDGTIASTGTVGTFTGTCSGRSLDGYIKTPLRITLDPSSRLGGVLTVSTCYGASGVSGGSDTTLYVGYGCGATASNYFCLGGNDDNSVGACAATTSASLVTITNVANYSVSGPLLTWTQRMFDEASVSLVATIL